MRTSESISWALVVASAIVSVVLWRDLREERQLVADLREQHGQVKAPVREPAQPLHLPTAAAMPTPQPVPDAPGVPRVPPQAIPVAPMPISPNPAVIRETRRAAAMAESDQAATGRTLIWRDRLDAAGLPLTKEQLQALNAAAIAQTRLMTEENLELQSTVQPTDMESVFRQREEALNRLNETSLRILRDVAPQLKDEQTRALRAQFDAGHAGRIKALHLEREQAMNSTAR